MVLSVVYVALQRVLQLLVLQSRSTSSKDLEIVVLRHQLADILRVYWQHGYHSTCLLAVRVATRPD